MTWSCALLAIGCWHATRIPLEWSPNVELPEITVNASWEGAGPRQIERYVTAPIERMLQQIPGSAKITSLSEDGHSSVTVRIANGSDQRRYGLQLSEQLSLLRDSLPEQSRITFSRATPVALRDQDGFMTLQVVGPQAAFRLRQIAEELKSQLLGIRGIADVTIEGGSQREILITLNPDQMARYGLRAQRVEDALRDHADTRSMGTITTNDESILVMLKASVDIDDLGTTVVDFSAGNRPVRLSDIGRVETIDAPRRSIARIDGQPVVSLRVDRARATNLIDVAERVHDSIRLSRLDVPDGVRILVSDDRSTTVREQLIALRLRGGLGVLLVILVLLSILRSAHATGIVGLCVVLSIVSALVLMKAFGLTLNLITIAGLLLVSGLLIDNAVVVVEQIMRRRSISHHKSYTSAVAKALKSVGLPLLGGTATTAAAMIPLVYLSGELRQIIVPFAVLVCLTLVVSLVIAVCAGAVLCQFIPNVPTKTRTAGKLGRITDYILLVASRHRWLTFASLALTIGVPIWLLPTQVLIEETASPKKARLGRLYNATVGNETVQESRRWIEILLGGVSRPFFEKVQFGRQWDFANRPEVRVSLR
ncbi:MAG: efflux RND transporter permease subunit, partial [Rhodothermales bacterium]|nr:efflux RND transporter permease subunit [Rhodothermales bacterium]